jgi:hypothetical protein
MARRASGRPFVAGRTNATMSEIVWSWSQTVQEWEDPGLQAIGKVRAPPRGKQPVPPPLLAPRAVSRKLSPEPLAAETTVCTPPPLLRS